MSIGVYRDESGTPRASCACDLPFAAYASAALTLIPVGAAEETIRTGRLPDEVRYNLHELMNVCVGFFNRGAVPRIRLTELCSPHDLPAEIATLQRSARALDLVTTIDGYGTGRLSLRCA